MEKLEKRYQLLNTIDMAMYIFLGMFTVAYLLLAVVGEIKSFDYYIVIQIIWAMLKCFLYILRKILAK